ncbi:alpha-glucosidase [Aspergillus luchuensis]|uniref:Alpha-glucosidase n=1 Tax=Aspergillus kawachii TaxID=1069201 RepID=A0A146FNU4_ASPKA|nr:alpha-glucosidase [Aspergillus luchuensis]
MLRIPVHASLGTLRHCFSAQIDGDVKTVYNGDTIRGSEATQVSKRLGKPGDVNPQKSAQGCKSPNLSGGKNIQIVLSGSFRGLLDPA